ncbi:MAG: Hsp20/alpha crystallin family protein [SAR324 cluster bacterium]|nr:Hsp20/alpha crystallin family protein [SAR324 cluster bacterium]
MWLSPYYSKRSVPAVNTIFDEFFKSFDEGEQRSASFSPRIDIKEDENAYHVSVEVPGIDKKDVEVSLKENILTIKGEKKQENSKKEEGYSWTERSYGSFRRTVRLPDAAQGGEVAANMENGILAITLPKAKQPEKKQITIN